MHHNDLNIHYDEGEDVNVFLEFRREDYANTIGTFFSSSTQTMAVNFFRRILKNLRRFRLRNARMRNAPPVVKITRLPRKGEAPPKPHRVPRARSHPSSISVPVVFGSILILFVVMFTRRCFYFYAQKWKRRAKTRHDIDEKTKMPSSANFPNCYRYPVPVPTRSIRLPSYDSPPAIWRWEIFFQMVSTFLLY